MVRHATLSLRRAKRAMSRFRSDEDGASTIEFVMLFTPLFILFLMAVEVGLYSIRHVGLERGTDLAVRQIRLNNINTSGNDADGLLDNLDIRDEVCRWSLLIPNCQDNLRVELVRTSIADVDASLLSSATACIDKNAGEIETATTIASPESNELMILRVCSLYDPIFPTSGIGRTIPKEANASGMYGLRTVSAFAVEPVE